MEPGAKRRKVDSASVDDHVSSRCNEATDVRRPQSSSSSSESSELSAATSVSSISLDCLEYDYIAAGSIRLFRRESIPVSQWKAHNEWQKLDDDDDLFEQEELQPFKSLHTSRWIRLHFRCNDEELGQARVYILPDDVHRRALDRSDRVLRKTMQLLLLSIDVSSMTWAGSWSEDDAPQHVYHDNEEPAEDISLFQLFNTLPSPRPRSDQLRNIYDIEAMENLLDGTVEGLKTKMLPYQRRSAALMLQREAVPGTTIDPRLTRPMGQDGKTWFCDLATGAVLKEPRRYETARGGICAETMGLGKTLICLSLILATREISSQIPIEYSVGTIPVRKIVGSLAAMCAANIGRYGTPWRAQIEAWENEAQCTFSNIKLAIKDARGCYHIPSPPPRRESRNPFIPPPRKVFLSTATLVVVPSNLVRQWQHEIEKHTTGLKVLTMKSKNDVLPPAYELLDYDIILFSRPRFEAEAKDGSDSQGRRQATANTLTKQNCQQFACEQLGRCRCFDADAVYYSPLKDIHFKRLITDEGHTMGNSSNSSKSHAVVVVDFLRVSSRWIISGTPTQGLYGLDVFTSSDESLASQTNEPVRSLHNETSFDIEQERKDLEKLGNIARVYLKARPWAPQPYDDDVAAWNTYVMQPRHGQNSYGNISCLRNTLETMIIRHRPEDVKSEIALPPLRQKIVYLDPSYQDKLSINIFSLMITSNAVTSERTDADYLFHPSQRKALGSLVSNLRQASFFWSGFNRSDLETTIKIANDYLDKDTTKIDHDDRSLLESVVQIGTMALHNQTWCAISEYHEMPLCVATDLPPKVRKAWSLDGRESEPVSLGATQLRALQKTAWTSLSQPIVVPDLMEKWEVEGLAAMAAAKAANAPIPRAPAKGKKKKVLEKLNESTHALAGGIHIGTSQSPKKRTATASPKTKKRKQSIGGEQPLESASIRPLNVTDTSVVVPSSSDTPETHDNRDKEIQGMLTQSTIVSTASAKLSYLLSQVSIYAADEKIIIFYEADNVAYYIAQALEVLGLPHLIYAKGISSDRRARYLLTFTASEKFRILLMDISQAAFGLDISVASRVYFVNPVLNRQKEAQAVKRAHRIGQTREVHVETLVLRETIEEAIIKRRGEMTQEEQKKVETVLDDYSLYSWIKNVRFVDLGKDGPPGPMQMAELSRPVSAFPAQSYEVENPDAGLLGVPEPSQRRVKPRVPRIMKKRRAGTST